MPTGIGNTPRNQIDALPVQSVADAIATPPTETLVVGGNIFKRWMPSATGINGGSGNVADPRTAGQVYLLTNWLDFIGMTSFTLLLGSITTGAGGDTAMTWVVKVIGACPTSSSGGGIVEPVPFPPGLDTRNLTGTYATGAYPQVGGLVMPALTGLGAFPVSRSAVCGWRVGSPGAGSNQTIGVLGTCRILLNSNVGGDPQQNFLTVLAQS